MDGRLVPEGYWDLAPIWLNFTANIAAVQFNHRLLASFALGLGLLAGALALLRLPAGFARRAVLAFAAMLVVQYALGIATLLAVVPVWLGTLHQSIAVAVLAAALAAIHGLRRPRPTASLPA
jgi:cytochrome c oxidase assembly protein subunit 15